MAIDWDDDFGNDPFGNGQSADVFGSNLDDVDVWKGHDSFDGDQEWIEFNDDEDDEGEPDENPEGASKSSSGKSSSSSGKRRSKKPGGSSRSSRSSSSRKTSSRSSSSSNSRSKKSSSKDGSRKESSRRPGSGDNKYLEEDDPFMVEDQHEHRRASSAPSSRCLTRSSKSTRVSMTPKTNRSGYTDDAIASSYRTSNSSRSSSSRRTPNLVRRADGSVSQRRPRDQLAHAAVSKDRRASVRDSLFKSLGEEHEEDFPLPPKSTRGPSLSGFLDHSTDKRSDRGRSDGSVRSAPASSEEHRRKSQQGRSRRWNNKMLLPPSGRESSTKRGGDEAIASGAGLNIHDTGYIEVVDGKMRLVFDVES